MAGQTKHKHTSLHNIFIYGGGIWVCGFWWLSPLFPHSWPYLSAPRPKQPILSFHFPSAATETSTPPSPNKPTMAAPRRNWRKWGKRNENRKEIEGNRRQWAKGREEAENGGIGQKRRGNRFSFSASFSLLFFSSRQCVCWLKEGNVPPQSPFFFLLLLIAVSPFMFPTVVKADFSVHKKWSKSPKLQELCFWKKFSLI